MLRRTETTIRTIVCAVMIVLLTSCGILMGSIQAWHRMGLCFLLAVYSAECCVCVLLNHKIESHFIQLEAQFTGKSPSDRLRGKFVPNSLIIFMIIFILVFFALVFLAGNCEYWLILSIPIVVFLIANFVFTAITVWLKIKYCTTWLEELVSSGREGEKHT